MVPLVLMAVLAQSATPDPAAAADPGVPVAPVAPAASVAPAAPSAPAAPVAPAASAVRVVPGVPERAMPAPRAIKKLRWSPVVDLPATAMLGAGWLISEFGVKHQFAPQSCRWCERNPLDEAVRTAFQPLVGVSGNSPADTASNIGWGLTVVATLGLGGALLAYRDDSLGYFPIDAMMVFEATFAAMAVNQTVKFAAGRERPFVSRLAPAEKPLTSSSDDNNLSFFSGHATFTMSIVVAAGTIAYLRNYRQWWLVWALGIPLSLADGILRLAADKHYFTDVLVGWLVGAGIGFSLPWFFHQPENALALRLVPSPGGIALAGRF